MHASAKQKLSGFCLHAEARCSAKPPVPTVHDGCDIQSGMHSSIVLHMTCKEELCTRKQKTASHFNQLVLMLLVHVKVQVVRPTHRLPTDATLPLPPLQLHSLRLLERVAA